MTVTRHFPRGRGARTCRLVAGVVLLSLAGALVSPVLADREHDLEHRKDHLDSQVQHARTGLDESSRTLYRASEAVTAARDRLSAARDRLAHVRGRLDAAQALDAQMRQRLARAEQRLSSAQSALGDARRVVQGQQAEIQGFAVRSYLSGDTGLVSLNLVLSGQDPTDLSSSLSAAESVVASQTADLDALDASRIMLSLRTQRVAALRDDVAAKRADAARNLHRSRTLAQRVLTQTRAVRALVDQARVLRDRERTARQHDLRLLQHRRHERDAVRAQLQALAQRQARQTTTTPTTTTSTGRSGGFLSYPIEGGYITSPYGMRLHPILHIWELHDGTDFGADCGTPVHAAAAGTIVSEYYDAAYGNRVIMNHGIVNGSSLSTSYNHLTSFVAGVGQYVQRGQLIAYSGTTGLSTGCHLHFMVYVNGATVDPMGWL